MRKVSVIEFVLKSETCSESYKKKMYKDFYLLFMNQVLEFSCHKINDG